MGSGNECLPFFFVHYGWNAVSVRDKAETHIHPRSPRLKSDLCRLYRVVKGREYANKEKGREATTRNLHKVAPWFSLTLDNLKPAVVRRRKICVIDRKFGNLSRRSCWKFILIRFSAISSFGEIRSRCEAGGGGERQMGIIGHNGKLVLTAQKINLRSAGCDAFCTSWKKKKRECRKSTGKRRQIFFEPGRPPDSRRSHT